MTRVASFAINQSLVDGALARQVSVVNGQQQVSSGKKADTYAGYSLDVSALVSAQSYKARASAYVTTNTELSGRLDQTDAFLSQAITAAQNFRDSIFSAVGIQDATALRANSNAEFQSFSSALNGQYDGQYLFTGARTNNKPVTVSTLDQLAALPQTTDAFANDSVKATARVADNTDLTYGVLASDVGLQITQVFRDIAAYDKSANGPLNGKLNDAQLAFLQSKISQLDTAIQGAREQQQVNGINQKQVDDFKVQQSNQVDSATKLIGDIQDVDLASAISKLQLDQTALNASYQVLAQVSQLSLTKYL